jgi:hypothetical protein
MFPLDPSIPGDQSEFVAMVSQREPDISVRLPLIHDSEKSGRGILRTRQVGVSLSRLASHDRITNWKQIVVEEGLIVLGGKSGTLSFRRT